MRAINGRVKAKIKLIKAAGFAEGSNAIASSDLALVADVEFILQNQF